MRIKYQSTLCPQKRPPFYFLNNSVKWTDFNNFWYVKSSEICPPHLSLATLRWEIQESHFNTLLSIYLRLFTLSQQRGYSKNKRWTFFGTRCSW